MVSLDHLVGAQQDRSWHFKAERLGSPEIEDKFKFCSLLDRNIAGLAALENLIGEYRCATECCGKIDSIADDAAGLHQLPGSDRKKAPLVRECRYCGDVGKKYRIFADQDRLDMLPLDIVEDPLEFTQRPHRKRLQLQFERLSNSLHRLQFRTHLHGIVRIQENSRSRQLRHRLLEQFDPFGIDFRTEIARSSDVAARPRHASYHAR